MYKTIKQLIMGSLFAAATVLATVANAHEGPQAPDGFVGDSSGHVVTDSSGNCVRTGTGSADATCAETAPVVEETAPAPEPQAAMETVTLAASALFDFDKATLRPAGAAALDELAAKIQSAAMVDAITVTGHTDSVGTDAYNQGLSERRANTVTNYLVSKGVDGGKITTRGMGESMPVADNSTADGRQLNRRVEVQISTRM
jgi:OOP family OmpA-OmpF porin